MAMKKPQSERYKSFHLRFLSLIDLKGKRYWEEELNVQPNLIWGWYHGNVPTMDYVLKVCELSEASANWLFLGMGEKFLKNNTPTDSLMANEREKIQEEFYLNDKKIISLKNEAQKEIENLKYKSEVAYGLKLLEDFFDSNMASKNEIKPMDIVSKIFLPILSFINKYGEKIVSQLEIYAESKEAEIVLKKLMNFIVDIRRT